MEAKINQDRNPFLPRRADNVDSKQIIDFFANHAKSAQIKERGHHIIIGASGAGKTTTFRYFSLKDQLDGGKVVEIDPTFVGVYASLKENIEIWRRKEVTEDLIAIYENYLNISIGYRIIDTIRLCASNGLYETNECANKNIAFFNDLLKIEPKITDLENIEQILDDEKRYILEYVNTEEKPLKQNGKKRISSSIITFIPSLCQGIINNSAVLLKKRIPFYLFLDYYDELQSWQQRVVNTLIQRPSEGYYVKLGSRPFGVYDYSTISGRSVIDSFEGRINLQYFRNEFYEFKEVLSEIVGRRLGWSVPTPIDLMEKLLPSEDPLGTAYRLVRGSKGDGQYRLFNREKTANGTNISEILEKIADENKQEKKRIISCVYQGFERLAEISDGNIGIFMELCACAWEYARQGKINRQSDATLPPTCQVNAVWNYSTYLTNDVEVSSSEGPYILNLISEISNSLLKKPRLNEARHYASNNIEIDEVDNLVSDSAYKIKKALQTGILLPLSSEGYVNISPKMNLSSFYLLSEGIIDLESSTISVRADDVDKWLAHLPDLVTKPIFKTPKPFENFKHYGFLSISFRDEEPASTARNKILNLFGEAPYEIECADAEKFGSIGSPNLLEKIRNYISNHSTFCLAEVSNYTPNTMLELGVIKGQNRLFWTLAHSDSIISLPDWIGGLHLHCYNFEVMDKDKHIDEVIKNHIISPLRGFSKKQFCPLWHGSSTCPYPISKDSTTVYISYPENNDVWNAAISEIRQLCNNLSVRLVTDKEIKFELEGTPSVVCIWCYAVRFAGMIFVDTTPTNRREGEDSGKKLDGDPTRCFVLGLAFGQRERKGKQCTQLIQKDIGKTITLWKGFPNYEWSTVEELIKIIKQHIEARLNRVGKSNVTK